jgi:hypothetical protein
MRSSFVARTGLPLAKAPSLREQAHRRRMWAICAMLVLALGSAAIGAVSAGRDERGTDATTGPFSYFPSE